MKFIETISHLSHREKDILSLRFLNNKTLDEVSKIYKVSEEAIRKAENIALLKVKQFIKNHK